MENMVTDNRQQATKVVIIGGGIGGLGSAILLAKQGFEVTVIEKNDIMGGRANLLEKDGFRRDMGPSRYLMPDMFEEFFESIGEDIHKRLDLKQLSPSYRIFPKGQIQHSNGNDDGKNNIGIEYDAPAIKQELSQLYAHAFSNEIFGIGYDSDYFESHIEDRSTRKDWRAVIYRDPKSKSLIGFSTGFGDGTYILDNCEPEILLSKLQEKGVDMNAIYRIDDGIVSPDFRGSGYGTRLLEEQLERARQKNYQWVGIYTPMHEDVIITHCLNGFEHIISYTHKECNKEYRILIKQLDNPTTGQHEKLLTGRRKQETELIDIYADKEYTAKQFESIEPGAGKQFLKFIKSSGVQYAIAMEFVKKNYDSFRDLLSLRLARKSLQLNIWTTIDAYVAKYFKHPLLQKIMQYTTLFLGTAPKQTPALFNIMSYVDFGLGVWYPQGGIHEIPKALVEIGKKYGVQYVTGKEIEKIVICPHKDIGTYGNVSEPSNTSNCNASTTNISAAQPNTPFQIINYNHKYLDQLYALHCTEFHNEDWGEYYSKETMQGWFASGNTHIGSMIIDNEKLVGYLYAFGSEDLNEWFLETYNVNIHDILLQCGINDEKTLWLQEAVIDVSYRNKGYFKMLIEHVNAIALSQGYTHNTIYTLKAHSHLIEIYTKNGFASIHEFADKDGRIFVVLAKKIHTSPTVPHTNPKAGTFERLPNGNWYFHDTEHPLIENQKIYEYPAVFGIVKHPEKDEYIVLDRAISGWQWFPGGGIEKEESAYQAIQREIEEETGYGDFEKVIPLGSVIEASYFHPEKKVNLHVIAHGFFIQLKSLQQHDTTQEELQGHKLMRISGDHIPQVISNKCHLMARHRYCQINEDPSFELSDADYIDRINKTAIANIGTCGNVSDHSNASDHTPTTKHIKSGKKKGTVQGVMIKDNQNPLHSSFLPADIVISNADLRYTETKLVDSAYQTYPETYRDKKVIAPSAFILYLGVKGELPQLIHHNLIFSENWDVNFEQIFKTPKLPDEPSYYLCKPSHTDPSVAPAHHENLFVLVPLAPELELSDTDLEMYYNQIISDISLTCAIPDLQQRIVSKTIFSGKDFSSMYHSYKGTALGLAHPLFQSALRRPKNISKKVDGLYYVGAYTNPGIGMPMCLISAMLLAQRIQNQS